MTAVLAVVIGGALGAPLRFLVDRYVTSRTASTTWPGELPWGLLVVNGLGSAAAGVVVVVADGEALILLLTGLCGAFTTFSGFAWESHRLWTVARGDFWIAVLSMFVVSVGLFLSAYAVTTSLTTPG
jgi:CrcB protein